MIGFAKIVARTLAAVTVAAAAVPAGALADAAKNPVVVELFTSQGCYSCPPADDFLGVLAKRPGVLALSFHVDYWNYLGWRDPYSSAEATRRQHTYASAMRRRTVYTPQMVVDGTLQGIGSYTGVIDGHIRVRQQSSDDRVAVSIAGDANAETLTASLKGDGGRTGDCAIWLVYFDKKHTTAIPRGENAGKTLSYYNVVREFRRVADYRDADLEIDVPRTGAKGARYDRVAVLVQQPEGGRIVGAAWAELK
ncbi:MAG: DUF1223 domain-containing protein [Rhodospirillaceae bacterium]|nr:DUF1223 domain-containing protein [Rhodospirillaceae bacterium]